MRSRKGTLILMAILIIAIVITAMGIAATSTRGYRFKAFSGIEAAEKIKNAQKTGGSVLLNIDEANELLQLYFKKNITRGKLTVGGINISLKQSGIVSYVPINYNGITLLLYSEGSLTYDKSAGIGFAPKNFKIGRLPVPKSLVLSAAKRFQDNNFTINNGNFYISKSSIPFDFVSIQIENDKLSLYIEKFTPKGLFQDKVTILKNAKDELQKLDGKSTDKTKIANVIKVIDQAIKNPEKATPELVTKVNKELKDIEDSTESVQSKNDVQIIQEEIKITDEDRKKQNLAKVNGELSAAAGAVNGAVEKHIIYMMQGTISKLISNPSYNYNADSSKVRTIYNKLSAEQKKSLKSAILQNIDASIIADLRAAFGI